MAQVSFICRRSVISTKPVDPRKFSTLSVLDRIMEHNRIHLVFYYKFPTERRPRELIDKLILSLSEMLSAFPIVTGRLLRTPQGHWMVKCNDAGVRMVEAEAGVTIDEWLKNVDRQKELKLVCWDEMVHDPYFWSPFYVQTTTFEGGGVAIGLSCTHLLSDPICATMLIRAWADTMLSGEIVSPPVFQPLPSSSTRIGGTSTAPVLELIDHYKSIIRNSAPAPRSDTKQATIAFHFNQAATRHCIAMAITKNANDHEPKQMPFQALAALFWTRISKIKRMDSDLVDMSICLDTREVLDLDKGFFGNCMVHSMVVQKVGNEVRKAAGFIKEAVSRVNNGEEVMGLIEWLEDEVWENAPWMNGGHLICVSLDNVNSHGVAFEEGVGPIRTSYYVEPCVGPGVVLVLPSPQDDGEYSRVVTVTLPLEEAEKLLEDEVIQQFGPNVLMGLSKKLS